MVGARQPGCISTYVKECFAYFEWAAALKYDVCSIGVVTLCCYFRSTSERGKSVPNLERCALVWCQECTKTPLGAGSREVLAFVSKLIVVTTDGVTLRAPVQALPVPPDTIIALDNLVLSAHTLPIRIFAGIAVLCCHGVKSWSDAQHVSDL